MKALIWDGAYFLPRLSTQASPLSPVMILYGTRSMSFLTIGSIKRRPVRRLIAKKVFSGLVTAWRLAAWPTRRSSLSVKATIEGVVRMPSLFSMTLPSPPSMTATQELVVPRSMPMSFAMLFPPLAADPSGPATAPWESPDLPALATLAMSCEPRALIWGGKSGATSRGGAESCGDRSGGGPQRPPPGPSPPDFGAGRVPAPAHISRCLQNHRGSFVTRPFGSLLRMRRFVCGSKTLPHPEERAERASRRTHLSWSEAPAHSARRRKRYILPKMIISASYKTDIPAFYGRWFMARLEAGFCRMVNPYGGQVYEVPLTRDAVDGFVFWTRNPGPFGEALSELRRRGFPFILQLTITGYPRALESSVIEPHRSIELAQTLAREFGAKCVVWR